jgi:Protein of unknown function (DUF551)
MNEWIGVKDRFPPVKEMIIFTDGNDSYCGQYEDTLSGKYLWVIADTWKEDSNILENITHWMPLPEPPK